MPPQSKKLQVVPLSVPPIPAPAPTPAPNRLDTFSPELTGLFTPASSEAGVNNLPGYLESADLFERAKRRKAEAAVALAYTQGQPASKGDLAASTSTNRQPKLRVVQPKFKLVQRGARIDAQTALGNALQEIEAAKPGGAAQLDESQVPEFNAAVYEAQRKLDNPFERGYLQGGAALLRNVSYLPQELMRATGEDPGSLVSNAAAELGSWLDGMSHNTRKVLQAYEQSRALDQPGWLERTEEFAGSLPPNLAQLIGITRLTGGRAWAGMGMSRLLNAAADEDQPHSAADLAQEFLQGAAEGALLHGLGKTSSALGKLGVGERAAKLGQAAAQFTGGVGQVAVDSMLHPGYKPPDWLDYLHGGVLNVILDPVILGRGSNAKSRKATTAAVEVSREMPPREYNAQLPESNLGALRKDFWQPMDIPWGDKVTGKLLERARVQATQAEGEPDTTLYVNPQAGFVIDRMAEAEILGYKAISKLAAGTSIPAQDVQRLAQGFFAKSEQVKRAIEQLPDGHGKLPELARGALMYEALGEQLAAAAQTGQPLNVRFIQGEAGLGNTEFDQRVLGHEAAHTQDWKIAQRAGVQSLYQLAAPGWLADHPLGAKGVSAMGDPGNPLNNIAYNNPATWTAEMLAYARQPGEVDIGLTKQERGILVGDYYAHLMDRHGAGVMREVWAGRHDREVARVAFKRLYEANRVKFARDPVSGKAVGLEWRGAEESAGLGNWRDAKDPWGGELQAVPLSIEQQSTRRSLKDLDESEYERREREALESMESEWGAGHRGKSETELADEKKHNTYGKILQREMSTGKSLIEADRIARQAAYSELTEAHDTRAAMPLSIEQEPSDLPYNDPNSGTEPPRPNDPTRSQTFLDAVQAAQERIRTESWDYHPADPLEQAFLAQEHISKLSDIARDVLLASQTKVLPKAQAGMVEQLVDGILHGTTQFPQLEASLAEHNLTIPEFFDRLTQTASAAGRAMQKWGVIRKQLDKLWRDDPAYTAYMDSQIPTVRELSRMRTPPGLLKQLVDLHTGAMVSALKTSQLNNISAGGNILLGRTLVNIFDQVTSRALDALQKLPVVGDIEAVQLQNARPVEFNPDTGAPIRYEPISTPPISTAFAPIAEFVRALGIIKEDPRWLDTGKRSPGRPSTKYDATIRLLETVMAEHGEDAAKLNRALGADIQSADVQKQLDAARILRAQIITSNAPKKKQLLRQMDSRIKEMERLTGPVGRGLFRAHTVLHKALTLNRAGERFMRTVSFVAQLNYYAAQRGMDLWQMERDGNLGELPTEIIDLATNDALDDTYAARPDPRSSNRTIREMASLHNYITQAENYPALLAQANLPFTAFMGNYIRYQFDWSPFSLLRLLPKESRERSLKDWNEGNRQWVGKMLWGTTAWMLAAQYTQKKYDELDRTGQPQEPWYEIAGKSVRGLQLAPMLFAADFYQRKSRGLNSAHKDLSELLDVMTGLDTKGIKGTFDWLDGLVNTASDFLSGQGGKAGRRLQETTAKAFGDWWAAFATPLNTFADIYGEFIQSQRKIKEQYGLGAGTVFAPVLNKLPGVRELLPDRIDPFTGQSLTTNRHPFAGQLTGMTGAPPRSYAQQIFDQAGIRYRDWIPFTGIPEVDRDLIAEIGKNTSRIYKTDERVFGKMEFHQQVAELHDQYRQLAGDSLDDVLDRYPDVRQRIEDSMQGTKWERLAEQWDLKRRGLPTAQDDYDKLKKQRLPKSVR